ncbi:AAA family ATPase [Chryseobacterium indologenes]|uniref:ATPase n=1 Tax=Chryseobacterium indologenes TaxID=253 RepID=A0A0N0ZS82_CHRID|nr:AAA family ATPase [Chryseobacterium indologenes]KPE49220.1 ATPase [Chryseobacterium indologenes]
MKNSNQYLYVITGGPGVGKTSLLEALDKDGFRTVAEEARRIIKEQMNSGGDALPWRNKIKYAELMLNASAETYRKIKNTHPAEPVFFDRGILDTACYMEMENIPLSDKARAIIRETTYNHTVFILPPWKEIYENDSERKQTWEEALSTFGKMKATYMKYGYHVVEVPKDTVKNRGLFVLEKINFHKDQ